ncbi:MAG: hypothetical protein AAGJ18_13765 [Bacteroidota bacterium]
MNLEIRESLHLVKKSIQETKQYLNREFRDYYMSVKILEPKEWKWVTKPFRTIENEKPNLPENFVQRCTKLYIDIFESEANKFLDLCRTGVEIREKGLPEIAIQKTIWNQYDLWRTKFTIEANSIIQSIDDKLEINIKSNGSISIKSKLLKKMIGEGKLKKVVDTLINTYELENETQNQLYGMAYRLNEIENQIINDIVNFSNSKIEKNKIANGLLKIVDKIK